MEQLLLHDKLPFGAVLAGAAATVKAAPSNPATLSDPKVAQKAKHY